ncbi:sulfurtransferase [Acidithrix sp. C25]|uniref:sulfurtransferase n=1 Tax=Acidithrix sp. C25 TaxID=1671482 RepID=UPI00191B9E23|nr:sulfurtransferase [Acidithrix sp. C25]CAG4926323.1 unnamed protein product [Acidithrix sp. C25]
MQNNLETLIDSNALVELIHTNTVNVIDARWYLDGRNGYDAYLKGHIPGSIFIDIDAVASDHRVSNHGRHPLPDSNAFQLALKTCGIDLSKPTVIYDDCGGVIAARIWWMNRRLGLKAAVLNGGIAAWDGPLETGSTRISQFNGYDTPLAENNLGGWGPGVCDTQYVKTSIEKSSAIVLDARDESRYRGDSDPVDPRPGHIPGAISLPTRSLLDHNSYFPEVEQLRKTLMDRVGFEPKSGKEIIGSCGSGITACHLALAFKYAFSIEIEIYEGSFSAWSRETSLPVATGTAPGSLNTPNRFPLG